MSVMLTLLQDQAIAARMALIVGAPTFDRLFSGIRFAEIEGEFLFAYRPETPGSGRRVASFARRYGRGLTQTLQTGAQCVAAITVI